MRCISGKNAIVWLALALLVFPAVLKSAELRDVLVDRSDDHYRFNSETWFEVSPEALYRVLSNYDLFTKFTSAIAESRNVEPDEEGRPQFYSRMEGCVLLWCKSFIRNGYLLLDPAREIVAITDPEKSDFKLSHEKWTLVPEGDGTLMTYEFEMVPDFWVPPIIGPFYIKRAMRTGGEKAVNRIEALALGKKPRQ
ncbi:MAG: SRPBCC family protein [Proteobacteria bacterium]|nr:SRPBCC family protein [Pseudomonadota bacterium]MDA0992433.1 SRPBCC family protein [Pseudomonadota bacterium]